MADRRSWTALVVALAAGLLIGFAATTLAYRYRIFRAPGQPIVQRLESEVGITAAQRAQVLEIMRDTRVRLRELRREHKLKRRAIFGESYARMRAILTPAQQADFDRAFPPPRWLGEREPRPPQ